MFPRLTPFAKQLLIGLFGIYVAELVLENWAGISIATLLALNTAEPGLHTLWQIVTYVVVQPAGPDGVIWFLLSLIFLWWAVAYFEERFGGRRAMQLAVVATLAAGACALVVGIIARQGPLYGFGPIMLSTFAAFAYSLRGRGTLSLFGLFPMKPMHLVYVLLGVSVLMFLASRNLVSLAADLGAVCAGVLFVQWMQRPRTPRGKPSGGGKRKPFKVVAGGNRDEDGPRWLN